jgi:hypothetical protein
MWGSTRIPGKVYQVLYPFKRHFRLAHGCHQSTLVQPNRKNCPAPALFASLLPDICKPQQISLGAGMAAETYAQFTSPECLSPSQNSNEGHQAYHNH